MLTNNFVNSTHYGELIDAVENVSDTSVNSIGSVESSRMVEELIEDGE